MRVFLSYASERKNVAEPIAFSLRARGHEVFLDKDDLPPGKSYDDRIEEAINGSGLFIFLISPESLKKGRYTLTELGFARQKWPVANRNVLPVVIEPVDFAEIPAYLKSVTVLEPLGNIAAEVGNAVQRLGLGAPINVILPTMALLGLVSGLIGGLVPDFLPFIGTGQDWEKSLFVLNFKYAPLHVGLLFGIVISVSLSYWERASVGSLVTIILTVLVGWISAHNIWRYLYLGFSSGWATNIPDSIEHAKDIQFQITILQYIIVLSISVLAGLIGALFTYFGSMAASKRLRTASVFSLVLGLGAILGLPIFFAVASSVEYLSFGLWQMGVAAGIGYGLSRPLR